MRNAAIFFALVVTATACATTPHKLLTTSTGKEMRWDPDRFPLRIGFAPAPATAMYQPETESRCLAQIRGIAREFNRIAGRELFKAPTRRTDRADIVISSSSKQGGVTRLRADSSGRLRRASVRLPCWKGPWLTPLIAHELLHALGFDHNPRRFAMIRLELRTARRLPNFLKEDLRALHVGSGRWARHRRAIASR